ncbi:ABC transporter permease [Limnoglobus roseus]|uniref:ABC transporter permease n=1 Tax=Limnoglobus roseus TaxID=2598579 RepID=A0A5C1A5M0_9BACT|nr:FtsX-like permease family protein [Limnoglobus roseus]QEL13617.1 ABC transporter permease [Limnoglobus roseus]
MLFLPRLAYRLLKLLVTSLATMFVLGLSLLPLSVLLLAVPAFLSQESVLEDTTAAHGSRLWRTLKRVFALGTGVIVLLAVLAVSVELVTRLPLPEKGSFGVVARTMTPAPGDFLGKTEREREENLSKMPPDVQKFMRTPLHTKLPPAMIEHWPFVILAVYAFDLLILVFIGKVPLAYNLRNVRVRWKTNLMTAFAFTAVIGLLTFLLAFVNGMNNLTENSGVPGNVFALSDGSTDEIFSNLGYGDIDNVERVVVELDEKDRVLKTPVRVKTVERDGKPLSLASKETYYAINMPVPHSNPPRRRFVQLRSLGDSQVAAEVHNVQLLPGGKWFRSSGVNDKSQIECVLGEGVAGVLAEDRPDKRPLVPGDVFTLGEVEWVVTGIMKAEGTTFGSEIWVQRFSRIYEPFGKRTFTTLVLRTDADTREASRAMAYHLSKRYTQQKLKAFSEPDYYAELTKTNNFFLVAVVVVAVVMAIGGVFGMMTTMFASIAQRIRDIGVLRLLGFKRWQVMVSFMLESLTIAVIGGAMGCLLAWAIADGRASTSTLSSGSGAPGGKSIALTINVDAQVMAMGMLFTLVMGRLGGLVPALSAMRLKILDSLR